LLEALDLAPVGRRSSYHKPGIEPRDETPELASAGPALSIDVTDHPESGSTLADVASEVYANRLGWPSVVAVTTPPLLLAGLGLTHPNDLSGASAGWWTSLHIILVPLFPLLGVSHWVLLHRRPGAIAWIGRVAAFLYIAFYAVTDHIAGIGNGVVMQQSGASSTSERPEIGWLFDVANDIGGAGTWALAVAAVATAVVAVRDGGRRVLPGGLLLVASSGYFAIAGVHIYWPRGVLTMLMMALAFGWLAFTLPPPGLVRQPTAAGKSDHQGAAE
jgi:hypothetical protein